MNILTLLLIVLVIIVVLNLLNAPYIGRTNLTTGGNAQLNYILYIIVVVFIALWLLNGSGGCNHSVRI